jgi:hypothetical protein
MLSRRTVRSSARQSISFVALLAVIGFSGCGGGGSSPNTGPTNPAGLTARDQGNGEVLLEWQSQPTAVSYLVQRTASGIPDASFDAGNHTNAMDFAGIAPSYSYKLLAIDAAGNQTQVGSLSYTAPAVLLASFASVAGLRPQLRSALGTNLNDVAYFSPELPFVDVMKSSSRWISGDNLVFDNGLPLDLDANGWVRSLAPGQIARKLMVRAIADHYPAGQYLVRYKGQGTLNFRFAASVVPGLQQPGQMLIQVTPDPGGNGILLEILTTNPADYVRDIEITMPGGICEGDPFTVVASASDCGITRFLSFADYPRSIVFYPVFANRLRAYSVLRFMDWMKTNNSTVANWSQVTPMSFHTWTLSGGAPVEAMIRLANRVGAHPWFNMPHQSDNAYAQNIAQMLRAQLSPALGMYVEDSNEVWNGAFTQSAYEISQAAAQIPAISVFQFHALRTRTLAGIFKSVLGAPRVVAALGAQAANTGTASIGLSYLQSRFGAPGLGIDAVAIAPYFGVVPTPATAATYDAMTLTEFFNYVATSLTEGVPPTATWMSNYKTLATTYGVRMISYEGGQHMVGILGAENDAALNTLFDDFNRDARIGPVYSGYLASWKAAGGELFVHFNDVSTYQKFGRWGALEYIGQPRATAPKFDAIQTFIQTNPVWWTQ